jgi:hypothetical protein
MSRAHRLEKLAKAFRDDEGDKQTIERVKTALDRLSDALRELDAELKTRRALDHSGVPRQIELELSGPFNDLRNFVANRGRPSPQRLQATTRSVGQQTARLAPDSRSRWGMWVAAELEKLPRHKAAALSLGERQHVDARIKELEALAKRIPNQALVDTFRYHLRQVHEDLGQVSLDESILEVLERFMAPEGVPLTTLSDMEIAVLRSVPEIAAQFVIRRQV